MTGREVARAARAAVAGPRQRRVLTVVVLPVLVALVPWYFGIDPWHALAFGAVALTVAVVWRAAPGYDDAPGRPGARPATTGVRDDVARLASAIGAGREPVGAPAVRRLRTVARTRLARHGVSLDDPAHAARVDALLGPGAARLLTDPDVRVRRSRFAACLDAVARLDGAPDPAGPAPVSTTPAVPAKEHP